MPAKTIDFSALGPMVFGEQDSSLLQTIATQPREKNAPQSRSIWWRTIVCWLIGPFTILALTEFLRRGLSVNVTTVGFAFLLAILIASTFLDLRFAVLMCITAALAYDYFFLPPAGYFNINDPQDWVALFAFLTTALIGTKLSATSRSKAQEATRRRVEVERLYSLSQRLLGNEDPATLLKSIPQLVAESLGIESAALYIHETGEMFRSNSRAEALGEAQMRNACYLPHPQVSTNGNISLVPVRLGEAIYGSLAFFGPYFSRETVDAAASLVAVAVARARALEEVAKVEAARESERLKSVLLDAITHDFRTPLASIKICATGLLEDLDFDRAQRKDLLAVIDEECDRISRLVGEASEMARLECGEVKLDIASHPVGDLISRALADCKNVLGRRDVRVNMQQPGRRLSMDIHLATKVLVHLVTNAHLYSAEGQPITISVEERNGCEFVSVADQGPGIDSKELALIFDKFYRGRHQRHRVQGTGMGLAIAKAIVQAHGGTISATSRPGQGSVFTFSLPLQLEHAETQNEAIAR